MAEVFPVPSAVSDSWNSRFVLRSGVGVDQACESQLINDGIKKVSGLNLYDPQHSWNHS